MLRFWCQAIQRNSDPRRGFPFPRQSPLCTCTCPTCTVHLPGVPCPLWPPPSLAPDVPASAALRWSSPPEQSCVLLPQHVGFQVTLRCRVSLKPAGPRMHWGSATLVEAGERFPRSACSLQCKVLLSKFRNWRKGSAAARSVSRAQAPLLSPAGAPCLPRPLPHSLEALRSVRSSCTPP